MKVKNLNPVERHVEKIVVGVAVAGAIYLLVQGALPATTIKLSDGTLLGPDQVESKVTAEVAQLEAAQRKIAAMDASALQGVRTNWVELYKQIHDKPLPPVLLTTNVPRFGPYNAPITIGASGTTTISTHIVAVPTVPPLQNATLSSDRALVLVPQVLAAGQPAVMVPQDVNWVVITGEFPTLTYRAALNNLGGDAKEMVPQQLQRISFVQVQVQRKMKILGGWTEWVNVPPTKAAPNAGANLLNVAPGNIAAALGAIDSDVKNILFPNFYTPAPSGTTPAAAQKAINPVLPAKIVTPARKAENAKTLADIGKAQDDAAKASGRPAPVTGMGLEGGAEGLATVGPTGLMIGGQAPDISAVRNQATIPVWFYDETVEPEHTYTYQWRMVVYNPVYSLDKFFSLGKDGKDEALRTQPVLASEWRAVAGSGAAGAAATAQPIEAAIKPNLSFFFQPNNLGGAGGTVGRQAAVRIFRWNKGAWYGTDDTVYPGMQIGSEKMHGTEIIDYSTHYTLVDVVQTETKDTMVVLLNPTGELVTRSVDADSSSPVFKELLKQQKTITPTTAPSGGTGGPKPPVTVPKGT